MGWENNSVFQVLIITGSTGSGVFVYSPAPGAGNLKESIAAVAGTDPYGNTYVAGVAAYGPGGETGNLTGGALALSNNFTTTAGFIAAPSGFGGLLELASPLQGAGDAAAVVSLESKLQASSTVPYVVVGGGSRLLIGTLPAGTAALLEVQGDLQAGDGMSIGQGAAVQTLINGSTINTAGITLQPVNCAAAVTGIILQAGTFDGQLIVIASNAAATRTITFAAAGTSNVSAGVAAVINPPLAMVLVWVSSLSLWFPVQ